MHRTAATTHGLGVLLTASTAAGVMPPALLLGSRWRGRSDDAQLDVNLSSHRRCVSPVTTKE